MKRRAMMKSMGGAMLASAAAPGLALGSTEKFKVGFVYVGPIGDHGWSYQHNNARLALEAELGDEIETSFQELIAVGADAERVFNQFALTGHKLIFATSFGYMDQVINVASRYPDVRFEHVTGYKRADNVATYAGRYYDGRYVMGQIAARMSKTGKLGYVASYPIPEVIRGINSYILGARSINPEITLSPVWLSTWFDPAKEADAASALLDQGVDVLTQHTDSAAPLSTAQERGAFAFGQSSNMIKFAPEAQLTSLVDNWAPYYIRRTREAMNGTWQSGDAWLGFDSGVVQLAPFTNMPDDVAAMAQDSIDKLSRGEMHTWAGPIRKQDGTPIVSAGEVIPEADLHAMNYYVEGVTGSYPS